MYKNLFRSTALVIAAFGTACSQPETALTDDPDLVHADQLIAENEIASATNNAVVKKIDATHLDPPREVQKRVSSNVEHAAPQQITQTLSSETSAPAERPQKSPFAVKRCINLGNALEAPNEGDWGYKIRSRDLLLIKRAGFDTVRLPVRWDTHTANRSPYSIDATFMTRVQTVVSQAQAAGLGIILDVHHFEKLMVQPKRQEARFLAMWHQIAKTFKDAPSNVYFEVLNEPTLEISMAEVNTLYAKVVPIIRATNPARKIIMGGNSWNSVENLAEVQWPNDPNIVATFHDYGPHAFTHQGAEWSEPVMPLGRRWGGQEDANELKSTYQIANAFRAKTGLPLFVGEFGVIDKVPQAQRMQWTTIRRQTMEANNIAWCVWDFSGAFKSYDLATEQWMPGVKDALFSR